MIHNFLSVLNSWPAFTFTIEGLRLRSLIGQKLGPEKNALHNFIQHCFKLKLYTSVKS